MTNFYHSLVLGFLLGVLLIFMAPMASGQGEVSPYESTQILENTVFNSPANNCFFLYIVSHPSNGSASVKTNAQGEKYIQYTPNTSFLGKDSISIEVHYSVGMNPDIKWFHYEVNVKESIVWINDIEFAVAANSNLQYLDVLSNDSSTFGGLNVKDVSLITGGEFDLASDSLYFQPTTDYVGEGFVRYTACDSLGECGSATAVINIIDSSNIATDDEIHIHTLKNQSTRILLPSDGYEIDSTPELGVVSAKGSTGIWEYKPFQNITGIDSFSLNLDEEYFFTVLVTIHDVPAPNTFLVDDFVFTPLNEEVVFNVLDNDLKNNIKVNSHTQPDNGNLNHLGDGEFSFDPDADFSGVSSFEYTVCILGNCETAEVMVFVGNLNPQNQETYQLTTTKNRPLVINYEVPISNFMFHLTQNPVLGELDIYPGIDTIQIGCNEVSGNNLVVYTPNPDVVGTDEFELEYCVDGQPLCQVVKIEVDIIDITLDSTCLCVNDCVWPGDVNYDGKVDMRDLLAIGWYMGSVGLERDDVDLSNWYGQTAEDWSENQISGGNLKHADPDGDGIVKVLDTVAISEFYNKVHTLLVEENFQSKSYPVDLVETTTGPYQEGDLVKFEVIVGSSDHPVVDLHGLALSFGFSNAPFDFNSLQGHAPASSWLTYDGPSIFMEKDFDNKLHFGLTRIDGKGAAGYGIVAEVSFVIENDIDGIRLIDSKGSTYKLDFHLDQVTGFFGNGREFQLPEASALIEVFWEGNDRQSDFDENLLNLFPNPASSNDLLQLHMNGGYQIEQIEVFDIRGNLIQLHRDLTNNRHSMSLENASSGLYIIRVRTDGGVISRKLQWINE